jgi:hypothetical protein
LTSIAIVVHHTDGVGASPYLLREIALVWKSQGFQVVTHSGRTPAPQVDLAIAHVDLTITPEFYRNLNNLFPRTLNARVTDISKRTISQHQVVPGDGYDGPVFLKTNCNFGGLQELRKQGPLDKTVARSRLNYRVLSSPRDVPHDLWSDPEWIVERFMSEQQDGYYCLRTWTFLGDKETNSICYSNHPIVKSSNVVRREVVAEVPAVLRKRREEMGFDFGKFDYAIVEGEVVLYDANRTPTLGNFQSDAMRATIELLAQGVHAFL